MVLRMIGVHDKHGIGKRNVEERRLLRFAMKKSCARQIHGLKRRRKKEKNSLQYGGK